MIKSSLFITPRAGNKNRCFIIPKDYSDEVATTITSKISDKISDKIREITSENNEITSVINAITSEISAITKEALQTSGGSIGNVELLSKEQTKEQIDKIDVFLQQHLKEVKPLVTEPIDQTNIMLPLGKLNQWLQLLEQLLEQRKWHKNLINWGIAAMIGLCCIVIAVNYLPMDRNITHQETQDINAAKKQGERLIAAIGGNREDVKKELTPFALPDANAKIVSDTWKINLGDKIKDSGPWTVSMFFQNVDGNTITTGLWGKNIDQLQIADTASSLQPLVQCRIAIRNLMKVTDADKVYTPFFQNEDFNKVSNPLSAVNDKIYTWTDHAHPDAVKAKRGCDTKPKVSENIISWIKSCVEPIGGGFVDDQDLQRIKQMGEVCSKVEFILPTVSNTGTMKK